MALRLVKIEQRWNANDREAKEAWATLEVVGSPEQMRRVMEAVRDGLQVELEPRGFPVSRSFLVIAPKAASAGVLFMPAAQVEELLTPAVLALSKLDNLGLKRPSVQSFGGIWRATVRDTWGKAHGVCEGNSAAQAGRRLCERLADLLTKQGFHGLSLDLVDACSDALAKAYEALGGRWYGERGA